jgi:hypothetical protein
MTTSTSTVAHATIQDLASQQAANLGHTYLGTEHLLLGLLQLFDYPAATLQHYKALIVTHVGAKRAIQRTDVTPTPKARDILKSIPVGAAMPVEAYADYLLSFLKAYGMSSTLLQIEPIVKTSPNLPTTLVEMVSAVYQLRGLLRTETECDFKHALAIQYGPSLVTRAYDQVESA